LFQHIPACRAILQKYRAKSNKAASRWLNSKKGNEKRILEGAGAKQTEGPDKATRCNGIGSEQYGPSALEDRIYLR
jgi:hypothetical protein